MRRSVYKRIASPADHPFLQLTMSYAISLVAICVFACGSSNAQPDDLFVSAGFTGKASVAPTDTIEMSLSRAMRPADGSLAVLIGDTDVTAMLRVDAGSVSYIPRLPLPVGESDVTVWLVMNGSDWKEVARFSLRVAAVDGSNSATRIDAPAISTLPSDSSSNNGQGTPSNNPAGPLKRRWGFDRIEPIRSTSINFKSQPTSGAFPEPPPGTARESFIDLAGQAVLGVAFTRGTFNWSNRFEIAGTSFRNEALRFGELGQEAPHVDLSSYLVQVQYGASSFTLGHVAFGTHRHLINNFSSRGLTAKVALGNRADFTAAAVNGTSIVGWNNFPGVSRREHRMVSGVLGFDFLRTRPQGLRIEAGVLSGSLLPSNNFSQRTLTDAERSQGGSLRLIASDPKNRFRLDAGFTRSRFTNPADPLLAQGLNLVPVREKTRSAHFADASFDVLREVPLNSQQKANLTFNFRHERVDPLFRSIASSTQADRSQNQIEIVGNIGEANFTVSHTRFSDNLDNVPSVLKSVTRRDGLIVNLPLTMLLTALISERQQTADPTSGQTIGQTNSQFYAWLPRVAFMLDRTHQFGASLPINGAFRPDLIPDQISLNYNVSADWQFTKWRLGYRHNRSAQDNRQQGRELADLVNLVNGLTLGLNPTPSLDVNFEINDERAQNVELQRTDRTLRYAISTNWRMTTRATISLNVSTIGAGDLARTSSNRTIEGDAQWSYRLDGEHPVWQRVFSNRVQAQFFIRYSNRFAHTRDRLFGFNNLIKIWTFNTGMSFTF